MHLALEDTRLSTPSPVADTFDAQLPQKDSFLFRLPQELRDDILTYSVTYPKRLTWSPIVIMKHRTGPQPESNQSTQSTDLRYRHRTPWDPSLAQHGQVLPPILLVSKRAFAEALPLFYRHNRFNFGGWAWRRFLDLEGTLVRGLASAPLTEFTRIDPWVLHSVPWDTAESLRFLMACTKLQEFAIRSDTFRGACNEFENMMLRKKLGYDWADLLTQILSKRGAVVSFDDVTTLFPMDEARDRLPRSRPEIVLQKYPRADQESMERKMVLVPLRRGRLSIVKPLDCMVVIPKDIIVDFCLEIGNACMAVVGDGYHTVYRRPVTLRGIKCAVSLTSMCVVRVELLE